MIELQQFMVESDWGQIIGNVRQLPDGRWSAMAGARPAGIHDRPADADAAVRAVSRPRGPRDRDDAYADR